MIYQSCGVLALVLACSRAAASTHARSRHLSPRQSSDISWYAKGCYVDSVDHRLLGEDHLFDNTGMSPQECQAYCGSKAFTAAGTEYGQECWCGYLSDGQQQAPASECNMPCTGNVAVSCGGSSRLNLYVASSSNAPQTNPGSNGWQSQGCWSDVVAARTLPYYIPQPAEGMSVNYCTTACAAQNYTYAGLEYAAECYCGNTINNGGASVSGTGCNMACSGNTKEWCGGALRMNLYSYTAAVATSTAASSSSTVTTSATADALGAAPTTLSTSTSTGALPTSS